MAGKGGTGAGGTAAGGKGNNTSGSSGPSKTGTTSHAVAVYSPGNSSGMWGHYTIIGYVTTSNGNEHGSGSGSGGGGGGYTPTEYYIAATSTVVQHPGTEDIQILAPTFNDPEPVFNTQKPSFTSNISEVKKYDYYFGLDSLIISRRNINQSSVFTGDDIYIGDTSEKEHIALDATYIIGDKSSVEFYIIDGDREQPIKPIDDTAIYNELIIYNMPTRFSIDSSQPYYIYKNNVPIDILIEDAISKNDGNIYTISYTPKDADEYNPINTNIKVKAILRLYDEAADFPLIESIDIRKYGGEMVWIDSL